VAVLTIFTVEGDAERLLSSYDEATRELERSVADGELPSAPGDLLAHVVCRRDDGMMVVDVWSSEAVMRRFVERPQFRRILEEHGVPYDRLEAFPVRRLVAATSALAVATRGSE
jgi:hypothetical protein